MKSIICLYLALFILAGCGGQKSSIKPNSLNNGKIEVSTLSHPESHKAEIVLAIIPLNNSMSNDNLNDFGKTLTDSIIIRLVNSNRCKVVERSKIEEVIHEIKLGYSGILDENQAVRAGRLLGANVISLGSLSKIGNKILLTMRLVKVETGEIIIGIVEKSDNISNFDNLADKAAQKIINSIK